MFFHPPPRALTVGSIALLWKAAKARKTIPRQRNNPQEIPPNKSLPRMKRKWVKIDCLDEWAV